MAKFKAKQIIVPLVMIALIIVFEQLKLSFWWLLLLLFGYGMYVNRAFLKRYCEDWYEQYKVITCKKK